MNYKKSLLSGLILFLFTTFIFLGCEQKKETAEEQQNTPLDTMTQQTPGTADTTTATQEEQTPDLKGEWTGNFGERKMTLNITSQEGTTFAGEAVVRWDKPKTDAVTGEINFDTREMKIKETGTRRNNGTYTGTVSADMKTFTGVWKDNGNRISYNFSLTKK